MKRRSFAEFALGGLAATGIGRGETGGIHPFIDTWEFTPNGPPKLNTVLYIPPSLDCELLITTEDWPENLTTFPYGQRDGIPITYRRMGELRDSFGNIVGTRIKSIEVLKVAPRYERWTREMPDASRFFYDKETDLTAYPTEDDIRLAELRHMKDQVRGYLKYPIENPTPGERLFTFLCFTRSQSVGQPCGCQQHQWFDEKGAGPFLLDHPCYTKVCRLHETVS